MNERKKILPGRGSGHSGRNRTIAKPQKRTVGLLIVLAAVFFVALFPAVYMNTIYGYLPAVFLAVLLVLSAVALKVLGNQITLETDYSDAQCERGSSVEAGLSIVNHSLILCPKAISYLFVSDIFGDTDAVSRIYLTMAARAKNNFSFDLDMSHIGVYKIGVKGMELYDFFGIFRRQLPLAEEFEVSVLPRIRDLDEMEIPDAAMAESVRETRSKIANGSDYIGVREYELGDSMKQIHWKLSAHSRDYMTKIFESNRETSFSVILDFASPANEDTEELMELNDCLIETALSILAVISRRHALHSLVYCGRDQELHRRTVRGREDDGDLIRDFAMIRPDPDPDFPDAAMILQSEQQGANSSSNLMIVTSRVTDELVQEILQAMRRQKRPELYYVIPSRLNSREREMLGKPLLSLDEAGIPHYFISTEENLRARSAHPQAGADTERQDEADARMQAKGA